ncbi:unnamed protein product [Prunus brigantina]
MLIMSEMRYEEMNLYRVLGMVTWAELARGLAQVAGPLFDQAGTLMLELPLIAWAPSC